MSMRVLILAASLATGCTYGGHYVRSGYCEGWNTDSVACERAAANMKAIIQVQVGHTLAQVRDIMGAPENREATADTERWGYLTNYETSRTTNIVFARGVVTEIQKEASLP